MKIQILSYFVVRFREKLKKNSNFLSISQFLLPLYLPSCFEDLYI